MRILYNSYLKIFRKRFNGFCSNFTIFEVAVLEEKDLVNSFGKKRPQCRKIRLQANGVISSL